LKRLLTLLAFIISLSFAVGCCVHTHGHRIIYKPPQEEFVESLANNTVALIAKSELSGEYYTYCSGVWVDRRHFITARHCIENDDESVSLGNLVKFKTIKEFSTEHPPPTLEDDDIYTGLVSSFGRDFDLAIVATVDDVSHTNAKVSDKRLYDGLPVHIVGHPVGLEYTYFTGIISKTRDIWAFGMNQKTLQITSFTWMGNSGCGAYDDDGGLVGIASFMVVKSGARGMAFYIHRDTIVNFLDDNQIEYEILQTK